MLTTVHGASCGLPKHGLGEQLIASSQLPYSITNSEQLVLVREPAASTGVSPHIVAVSRPFLLLVKMDTVGSDASPGPAAFTGTTRNS